MGKPRTETGRGTQTNSISDHRVGKPLKLLKVSYLGIHLIRPDGTYFKSNYGCWAFLVIY
jgi:hypothetical protein